MKTNFYLITFLSLLMLCAANEEVKKPSNFNRKFSQQAYPGSYEELTLTREHQILLKKYEPITLEKISALVHLRVISKAQSIVLKAKLSPEGKLNLTEVEEKISVKKVPMELVQRIMEVFQGPYSEEALLALKELKVIDADEMDTFKKLLDDQGRFLNEAPEEAVIVVKDNWHGVPLNSRGLIDTDLLLTKVHENLDVKNWNKLVMKHQDLLVEINEALSYNFLKDHKDVKKAKAKQEKKLKDLAEKIIPIEADIAEEKMVLSYLYLAGIYQIRYDSEFLMWKDIDRDDGILLKSLINKADSKKKDQKVSLIGPERCHLSGLEKFICIDKSLLWLTKEAKMSHKRLAVSSLKLLLDGIAHPPWDAPKEMWTKWWQMSQRNIYIRLVGDPSQKEVGKEE